MFKTRLMTRLIAYSLALSSCIGSLNAADVDEDGIDDELEALLIDMYRPRLHYDSSETVSPVSVEWFIRHSELIWRTAFQGTPLDIQIFTNAQLNDPNNPNSPLLILQAGDGENLPFSSTTREPGNVGFRINILDEFKFGPGMIDTVGMYAHVVRLNNPLIYNVPGGIFSIPPNTHDPHDFYLIQFWQFLPFNNFQFTLDIGNHEGDWMWIDVFVERDCPYELRYIVYHHHGDSTDCGVTVLGGSQGPLPTEMAPYPLPCAPNNLARIPQCFLESGAHEWWPEASGGGECEFCVPCLAFAPCCTFDCCKDNPSHNGALASLRSQNVLNLGERFAPMPGLEPQLVMHFNGLWGHNHGIPNGPSGGPLRQESPGYPFSPLFVAHVDPAAEPWSEAGLGSRYHPLQSLDEALDGPHAVETGGTILMAPGTYSGHSSFTRPMKLGRDGGSGTVRLEQ